MPHGVEIMTRGAYVCSMRDITKIATCSYCGTRSILHLAGQVQHELACSACGARLHTMKHLRAQPKPQPERRAPSPRPRTQPQKKRRIPKRHRFKDLIEDLWDEIEDIFD